MKNYFRTNDSLVPSQLEALLYLVLSGILIFLANMKHMISYLTSEPSESGANISHFEDYISPIIETIEAMPFLPSGAVFLFWSIIGLVFFSIFQSVYNVYGEVRQDIYFAHHFLHPKSYVSWQFWVEIMIQFMVHFSLNSMLIMWGALLFFVLNPLAAYYTRHFFTDLSVTNLLSLISSLVLLYVGVIIFAIIVKLFMKRKQMMV